MRAAYLQHGRRHGPNGSDPIPGAIYVDDRILDADTDAVVFDSFPSDLTVLELTWEAWMTSGSDFPATMYVAFNGDYPSTEEDYWWRLSGSVEENTDAGGNDSWGGLALIADSDIPTTGRVRFIDYTRDVTPNNGWAYIGEGSYATGGYTPDAWVIAGARGAASGPIADITVHAGGGSQEWETGSRFTLTGY